MKYSLLFFIFIICSIQCNHDDYLEVKKDIIYNDDGTALIEIGYHSLDSDININNIIIIDSLSPNDFISYGNKKLFIKSKVLLVFIPFSAP